MIDAYDTAACPSNTDCGLQFVVQITDAIVASGVSEFGRIRTLTDLLTHCLHAPCTSHLPPAPHVAVGAPLKPALQTPVQLPPNGVTALQLKMP